MNRHPVDELADLRFEIALLQRRADALRDVILSGGCSLVGDEHRALIQVTNQNRVDVAALRRELSPERLRPFVVDQTVRRIELARV
jgi:hypothetical protein